MDLAMIVDDHADIRCIPRAVFDVLEQAAQRVDKAS
jgi:hypothetical protein